MPKWKTVAKHRYYLKKNNWFIKLLTGEKYVFRVFPELTSKEFTKIIRQLERYDE